MSDYEIDKKLPAPRGTKCNCGHSVEVHGTNGKICGGCECRGFVEAFDPKRPMTTTIIGLPVVVSPVVKKGEIFLANKNIPQEAHLICRTLEELAEYMVRNDLVVCVKNVSLPTEPAH